MDEKSLGEMLDKAEAMGYEKGVKSVFLKLLQKMDEEGQKFLYYEVVKKLFHEMK